jgi:hypothetical protein
LLLLLLSLLVPRFYLLTLLLFLFLRRELFILVIIWKLKHTLDLWELLMGIVDGNFCEYDTQYVNHIQNGGHGRKGKQKMQSSSLPKKNT